LALGSVGAKKWNILSLDGGGIRGLMGAYMLDHFENRTYEMAIAKPYCMPKRKIKKVSMSEIFDLVAGTSTGSILGAIITSPNNNTKTMSFQKN
jgi:patatin-like phospholipase/acyl hydrolase